MTSSKPENNWEKTMSHVNEALRTPTTEPSGIYQHIIANFDHIEHMLTGDKAEEYGNPQTMCRRIGQRWYGTEKAETDVAIRMAELKIERIKFDPTKEDSYLDAIAYLAMALAFMQANKGE